MKKWDHILLKRLKPKSEFARNTLILISGTALAQAIPLALTPVLTRLYTPEDFGLLALFYSLSIVLSSIATGRYEFAILAPASVQEAKSVVLLSFLVSFIVFLLLMLPIVIFNDEITSLIGNQEISIWLYFVPFIVLLLGVYRTIDYWLNRQKKYKKMSHNKLIRASGISLVQLLISFSSKSGLIAGFIIGWLISVIIALKTSDLSYKNVNFSQIKESALKYKDYPIYQMPSSLLNSISLEAPVFFISKAFDASIVGFFSVVIKLLSSPAGLISRSTGQVYFQRASEFAKNSPELLLDDLYSVAKKLSIISLVIFSPIFFFGMEIFGFILGSEWEQAGKYSEVLVFAIAIKFVVSPLSIVFMALDKIKISSVWQVSYFITTMVVLYVLTKFSFDIFLWVYVIHEIMLYTLYFLLMIYAIKRFQIEYIQECKN